MARNVELCMTDILIQLLEDVGILGAEITELILEEFEKFDKVLKLPFSKEMIILFMCEIHRDRKIRLM